jgi:hypothetical protein
MFRKTTLLGACVLLPAVTNILLVDIFYAIAPDALLVALVVEVALLIILAAHKDELRELFWSRQNSLFPSAPAAAPRRFGKHAVRVLMLLIPAVFTYWVANNNNRRPTPLDGVWDVAEVSQNLASDPGVPTVVFFERNRAFLCVFKFRDGSYKSRHFEVNAGERAMTVWRYWLSKGAKVFDGRYELSGGRLRLSGKFGERAEESSFVLTKRE